MFDVSNVSFIHMISQIYRHTYPFLVNMYIYICVCVCVCVCVCLYIYTLVFKTQTHNEPQQTWVKGPKALKPKMKKQREGKVKRGRKKKFLSTIPISDLEQRQARGKVESESLTDLPVARRRRSSCHGFVTTRSK